MGSFKRENMTFRYLERGEGLPFIFQHGIGGDLNQPMGFFKNPEGIRLLAFDFRAHGETTPVGDPKNLNFFTFADDLIQFMDDLKIPKAIVGGISMGAGVAMNTALRYPDRVIGLVLSRPAWLDGPMSDIAVDCYSQVTELLRKYGPSLGQQHFMSSENYRKLLEASPDAARSMAGQFLSPHALEFVIRLELLPREKPIKDLKELANIKVPTIVFATKQDPIHPFEYGQCIAKAIPGADFIEITPKSVSTEKHAAEWHDALMAFLLKTGLYTHRKIPQNSGY